MKMNKNIKTGIKIGMDEDDDETTAMAMMMSTTTTTTMGEMHGHRDGNINIEMRNEERNPPTSSERRASNE